MAKDIYGRNIQYGGAYSADEALLTLSNGADMLVTQVQWSYPQDVKMMRSLSSKDAYIHGGPSGSQPGRLVIGTIIGPKGIIMDFITSFADVCQAENNDLTLTFAAGCEGDITESAITLNYCVLTDFGGQGSHEDFLFRQNLQLAFFSLSVD